MSPINCVFFPADPVGSAAKPAQPSNSPSNCDHAARFEELLKVDPQREILYVNGPAQGSDANPVMHALSQFQSAEVRLPDRPGSGTADSANKPESSEIDRLVDMGHEALQVQAQILRTTLMMETMSAAKQGVSTMFQMQG